MCIVCVNIIWNEWFYHHFCIFMNMSVTILHLISIALCIIQKMYRIRKKITKRNNYFAWYKCQQRKLVEFRFGAQIAYNSEVRSLNFFNNFPRSICLQTKPPEKSIDLLIDVFNFVSVLMLWLVRMLADLCFFEGKVVSFCVHVCEYKWEWNFVAKIPSITFCCCCYWLFLCCCMC